MPLHKLLFANFSRLDAVRTAIVDKIELRQAAEILEKQSHQVIREILKVSGDLDPGLYPARQHVNVENQ